MTSPHPGAIMEADKPRGERHSPYHKGVNLMSTLQQFIRTARADEPVYICDVRDAFQREGARPFDLHAVLYDGSVRRFALKLPDGQGPEEAAFIEEYLYATLYNLLSALGARVRRIRSCAPVPVIR